MSQARAALETSVGAYRQTIGDEPRKLSPGAAVDSLIPKTREEVERVAGGVGAVGFSVGGDKVELGKQAVLCAAHIEVGVAQVEAGLRQLGAVVHGELHAGFGVHGHDGHVCRGLWLKGELPGGGFLRIEQADQQEITVLNLCLCVNDSGGTVGALGLGGEHIGLHAATCGVEVRVEAELLVGEAYGEGVDVEQGLGEDEIPVGEFHLFYQSNHIAAKAVLTDGGVVASLLEGNEVDAGASPLEERLGEFEVPRAIVGVCTAVAAGAGVVGGGGDLGAGGELL